MANSRLVLTLALVSSLVGCVTVGPDYQAPANQAQEITLPEANLITTITQEITWWQKFNDPDLDRMVGAALQNSPTIAAAKARVRAAYAVFDDIGDDFYPKGSIGAGYNAAKAPVSPDFSQRVKTEQFNAGLDTDWQLDLFGRVQRTLESAEADAESQAAALRGVQVEIIASVVKTYGELRAAQHRIQVAEDNLKNLQEVVNLTQVRFDSGAGSELDLARIRAEYAGNQANIPPLRAQMQVALHGLEALTGQTVTDLLKPKPLPAINTALAIGNPAELLQRRPDIQQAERRLAAANAQIGVATADLFPQVEMSGFLGFISASGSRLGSSGSQAWSITPTLKWQVLDFASLKARVRVAEAQTDLALANYHEQVLGALEETRNALVRYDLDQQRFRYLLDQEKNSAQAQTIAQARYKAGIISLLDVLDTERTRLAAEDAVAQGELVVFQGIAEIYRALGGGWEAAQNMASAPIGTTSDGAGDS